MLHPVHLPLQVRLKMSETLREACTFIEQGHVRVGPDTGAGGPPHVGLHHLLAAIWMPVHWQHQEQRPSSLPIPK